ncbi:hypothetical protein VQ042_17100 [Aurantimonas sp. A2-1-M11]|uniref:hypothetical protein n=1 Tax=Aurantimonas sp. A2-1-M11 TaxID=3113712 RepID=UPI002F937EBF
MIKTIDLDSPAASEAFEEANGRANTFTLGVDDAKRIAESVCRQLDNAGLAASNRKGVEVYVRSGGPSGSSYNHAANGTEFKLLWRGGRFQIVAGSVGRVSVYPTNPKVRRVTLNEAQAEIVRNAAVRPFPIAAAAAPSKLVSSQTEANDHRPI